MTSLNTLNTLTNSPSPGAPTASPDLPGTSAPEGAGAQVLTRTGWTAVGLAAVSLLAGATLGWQEAWAGAAALIACLLTALGWILHRGGHTVTHGLIAPRIAVGDHALVRVTASNEGTRALLPTRMEMPMGEGLAEINVPLLHAGQSHDEGFALPTERRGVLSIGPVLQVVGDPLGLARRTRAMSTAQTVHVHPRTVRIGQAIHGVMRDIEGAVTQDLSMSDASFHALRPYVPGDDRRHVHWKSSARTGTLMVRQFEATQRASLLTLLSVREDDYLDPDHFETAVSAACSLALSSMMESREVALLTQRDTLPTTGPTRLLDASCTLDLTGAEELDALVNHGTGLHPGASIVALITGTGCSEATLAKARLRIPAGMSSIIISCGAAEPGISMLASTPVLNLDTVDSLPQLLRRAL